MSVGGVMVEGSEKESPLHDITVKSEEGAIIGYGLLGRQDRPIAWFTQRPDLPQHTSYSIEDAIGHLIETHTGYLMQQVFPNVHIAIEDIVVFEEGRAGHRVAILKSNIRVYAGGYTDRDALGRLWMLYPHECITAIQAYGTQVSNYQLA